MMHHHEEHMNQPITAPSRCASCDNPMDTPIACAVCGTLSQLPVRDFNCFEVFGLVPDYDLDLDALYERFLTLSRVIHPDVATQDKPAQREQALRLSAEFNRAYDTLRDPVTRAEYLLSLAGGPGPAEDKFVPAPLLGEVMMLREEIDEAQAGGDGATLQKLRQQIEAKREAGLGRIAELARKVGPTTPDTRKALRLELNVMKYWLNLLSHLPEPVNAS